MAPAICASAAVAVGGFSASSAVASAQKAAELARSSAAAGDSRAASPARGSSTCNAELVSLGLQSRPVLWLESTYLAGTRERPEEEALLQCADCGGVVYLAVAVLYAALGLAVVVYAVLGLAVVVAGAGGALALHCTAKQHPGAPRGSPQLAVQPRRHRALGYKRSIYGFVIAPITLLRSKGIWFGGRTW
jgi:hypothetical protein